MPKVVALVLGKHSLQVVTQRAQRLALATSTGRDDGSYSWDIANIGAHAEGERKGSRWHEMLDSSCPDWGGCIRQDGLGSQHNVVA